MTIGIFDPVLNFAKVSVSIGYAAGATSIVLATGHGAKLPQPSTDGAFNLVWWDATNYNDPADDPSVEIVRCTARTDDTLTVTRAQEGTAASNKNTGSSTYKMILSFTSLLKNAIEAAIVAHTGATAKAAHTGGTGAHDHTSTAEGGVLSVSLGAWATKTVNTVYQATTDGFVIANTSEYDPTIVAYTDSSNPPTTIRAQFGPIDGGGSNSSFIFMPVKKNDYWKVTLGWGTNLTVYWIPLGA